MAGALDQILQEQVVGALFRLAQAHLRAVQRKPFLLADIVVEAGAGRGRLLVEFGHGVPWDFLSAATLAPRASLRQRAPTAPACRAPFHDAANKGPSR